MDWTNNRLIKNWNALICRPICMYIIEKRSQLHNAKRETLQRDTGGNAAWKHVLVADDSCITVLHFWKHLPHYRKRLQMEQTKLSWPHTNQPKIDKEATALIKLSFLTKTPTPYLGRGTCLHYKEVRKTPASWGRYARPCMVMDKDHMTFFALMTSQRADWHWPTVHQPVISHIICCYITYHLLLCHTSTAVIE